MLSSTIGISSSGAPLTTQSSFQGKKIRSAGPIVGSILKAAGASPVSLGGGEVYQALQTNMVDGALTTLRSVYMRRYYEVNDWVTVTPLFPGYFAMIVNQDWWESLSQEDQKTISEVSQLTEKRALELTCKLEAETPDLLRANGMNVYIHSKNEIKDMRSRVDSFWMKTYHRMTGERGIKALKLMEKWQLSSDTMGANH